MPAPSDALEKIGRVIGRLADDHVPPAQLLPEIERQIPELERWVRDHDLIELDPTKPLIVRETPPHKRGIAGASIDSPGPYDAGAPTYYNVTPLDDLPAARAESWLREYNRWMLPVLNIHEAIPGHYVQLVYANRSPSLIKSIFGNGAMIEGLGRLLRAHDARVGLRRAQSRGLAHLFEVEPAQRLQHDPRLRRACARYDRGRSDRPIDAAGVPNRSRSSRQMAPREARRASS